MGELIFMEIKEFNIKVPQEMYEFLSTDEDKTELERNAMILYPYIRNMAISHGRAAEILGISKWELITIYDKMGLAYLDQDIEEVKEDMRIYKMLKGKKYDCNI